MIEILVTTAISVVHGLPGHVQVVQVGQVGQVGQAGDVVVAQVQGGQGDEVGQALTVKNRVSIGINSNVDCGVLHGTLVTIFWKTCIIHKNS